MLPSEFLARASSEDVGLLLDYYAAQDEARAKAKANAELLAGADRNAADARERL